MAEYKCKDTGVKCNFELKDEKQEEMMEIVSLHASKSHNMKLPLPDDELEKIRKAIKR